MLAVLLYLVITLNDGHQIAFIHEQRFSTMEECEDLARTLPETVTFKRCVETHSL